MLFAHQYFLENIDTLFDYNTYFTHQVAKRHQVSLFWSSSFLDIFLEVMYNLKIITHGFSDIELASVSHILWTGSICLTFKLGNSELHNWGFETRHFGMDCTLENWVTYKLMQRYITSFHFIIEVILSQRTVGVVSPTYSAHVILCLWVEFAVTSHRDTFTRVAHWVSVIITTERTVYSLRFSIQRDIILLSLTAE